MQPENDTSPHEDSPKQETGEGCPEASCSASSGKAIPRDRPWHLYPNGTKAPSWGGGHWVRVTGGWEWRSGDVFPRPGGDNMDQVILPQNPPDRER